MNGQPEITTPLQKEIEKNIQKQELGENKDNDKKQNKLFLSDS